MEQLRARVPKTLLKCIERGTEEQVPSTAAELSAFLDHDAVFHEILQPLSCPNMTTTGKDYEAALKHKSYGNNAFGRNVFQEAVLQYSKALKYMPSDSDTHNDMATVYANRAASLHKLGLASEGERDCTRAILLRGSYAKAWYRRGCIKADMLDYGALMDMKTALVYETSANGKKQVQKELLNIEEKLKKAVKLQNRREEPKRDEPYSNSESSIQTETYHTSTKQWGLRTTAEVRPGALVHAEDASAAILLKEHRNTHCHFCFEILPADCIPCNGCAVPSYCSEACRDHATVEHKNECGGTSWAVVLPTEAVLASRMLSRTLQVEQLCHHYDDVPCTSKVELHLLAVVMAKCLKNSGFQQDGMTSCSNLTAELVILIAKVRSNSMAIIHMYSPDQSSGSSCRPGPRVSSTNICGIEHVTVAQGLFLLGSKFNHSCNPNVHASYIKRSLRVYATRVLPAYSPTELSYGAQVGESGRSERQKWLKDRYFFICECDSCYLGALPDMLLFAYRCGKLGCNGIVLGPEISNEDFPVDSTSFRAQEWTTCNMFSKEMNDAFLLKPQIGCCLKCGSMVDIQQAFATSKKSFEDLKSAELRLTQSAHQVDRLINDAMQLLDYGRRNFHPFNKQLGQMEDIMAKIFCEAKHHLPAVHHCQKSIEILEHIYGIDHIAVAYERVKLASIALAADDPACAKECLEMANRIFCNHYGHDYGKSFPDIQKLVGSQLSRCHVASEVAVQPAFEPV